MEDLRYEYMDRVAHVRDVYVLPASDSGYGFSIGDNINDSVDNRVHNVSYGYNGDLKDSILNYDTMLKHLYDNDVDAFHKDLLNRPVVIREIDKNTPTFDVLYTYDEVETIKRRRSHMTSDFLEEAYKVKTTSDDVGRYSYLTDTDMLVFHKLNIAKYS